MCFLAPFVEKSGWWIWIVRDCSIRTIRKRRPRKIAKNWQPLPLSARYPHWLALPPLSVQTHHKFRKIRSFCTKKCKQSDIRIWRTPCPTGHTPYLDCGCLLWTAAYQMYLSVWAILRNKRRLYRLVLKEEINICHCKPKNIYLFTNLSWLLLVTAVTVRLFCFPLGVPWNHWLAKWEYSVKMGSHLSVPTLARLERKTAGLLSNLIPKLCCQKSKKR